MQKIDRRKALKVTLSAAVTGLAGSALLTACNEASKKSEEATTPTQPKTEGKVGEPDYSLQTNIEGLKIPDVITVIGCGGFGAWPALLSGLSGVKKLVLIDMGTVDALDLARAPFLANQIGMAKSEALTNVIKQFRPSIEIKHQKMMFTMKDVGLIEGTIFDGTNDLDLAKNLPIYATKNNLKYLTGFYKGNITGTFDKHHEGLTFESGTAIPVWIGSAAFGGILSLFSAYVSPINFVANPTTLTQETSVIVQGISAVKEAAK